MPTRLSSIAIASAICLLGACAIDSANSPDGKSQLRQVQIEAGAGANSNSATTVDIVLVFDSNIVSELPKTAPEWFNKKAALSAGLASGIEVISLQMPPSTTLKSVPLPGNARRAAVTLIYASYLTTDGQAVGNLTSRECTRIVLTDREVIYDECT